MLAKSTNLSQSLDGSFPSRLITEPINIMKESEIIEGPTLPTIWYTMIFPVFVGLPLNGK